VLPGHTRTASQVMGELLTRHPEAASLQAEASHRRALACDSKLIVSETLAVEQAARLGYEELRHRLDPRRLHTVNFAAGMLVLILLSALPTLAATAVWLTGAWVTALAGREGRWPVVLVVGTAAVLLGAMLAGVDGLTRHSLVFAVLISAFILVFAGGAAVLMARMESASLPVARRRWHRARAAHEAAVKAERGDVEAAAVATEAWLGLVRASAVADADEDLARETVALAVALLESGHPRLPFPE
jgi:hypothetical protein